MNRRRFLMMTACLCAARAEAAPTVEWQGAGFGTALSLRLVGADPLRARRTLRRVEAEIERIEASFSLRRDSALTRLNRDGHLAWPSPEFRALMGLCARAHAATDGAFDPTVQPLWRARAEGGDTEAARAAIGWNRVRVEEREIRLAPGQALTFNGIAQGWAADRIAALLRAEGYGDALIDMGEVQALGHRQDGGDWIAAIAAPSGSRLAESRLLNRALATSSPLGTVIGGGQAHILGPAGQAPLWSTVSVSAPEAAVADALSTAFCLMERPAMDAALRAFPGARIEIAA
ncbi:FAD:protein FMN transferase [Albidovulum sediminicola]|uniref:FAD:protein FMN transferase n=1 Tax=Albidovulum sediminicola TaxID=2984331 RepID=A0ABT2Z482_9RHOB|nr:FAD:protein FMN transferase [Defluviimonas sp. WL0075]MCV2865825.1 FAD:protein FMN transferase [Defluviimonas sp. WL0075]